MDKPTLTPALCRGYIEKRLFEPVSLVKNGELPEEENAVGIELELFPYAQDINKVNGLTPVPLHGGVNALTNVLAAVSSSYGGVSKYWYPANNLPGNNVNKIDKIEFPNGDRFLFEPGGQVEISTAPCSSLVELETNLLRMQEILAEVSRRSKIQFVQTGTNHWFTVDEIGNQLQKPRYKALEKYFDSIGPYGKQMMLQTCSLHINLDLGVQITTRIKRIAAANLLAPFATALFANSSTVAGKSTGHKSFRSYIWQHADTARTGILSSSKAFESMSMNDFIDAYCEFVLKAPLIYIDELADQVFPPAYTFEFWLQHAIEGIWPGFSNLENHISLLFPEVRVKGYLEIRSVDAPPVDWQMVPVCFYAGLFYNELQLDKVLELLLPYAPKINDLLRSATRGMESDEIYRLSKQLAELAIEGFSGMPPRCKNEQQQQKLISFYENFILQRRSFCDEHRY